MQIGTGKWFERQCKCNSARVRKIYNRPQIKILTPTTRRFVFAIRRDHAAQKNTPKACHVMQTVQPTNANIRIRTGANRNCGQIIRMGRYAFRRTGTWRIQNNHWSRSSRLFLASTGSSLNCLRTRRIVENVLIARHALVRSETGARHVRNISCCERL